MKEYYNHNVLSIKYLNQFRIKVDSLISMSDAVYFIFSDCYVPIVHLSNGSNIGGIWKWYVGMPICSGTCVPYLNSQYKLHIGVV